MEKAQPDPPQFKVKTQPAAPLNCNMYAFAELVLFCIACISSSDPDYPSFGATLINFSKSI